MYDEQESAAASAAVSDDIDKAGFEARTTWPRPRRCHVEAVSRRTGETVFSVNVSFGDEGQVVGIVRPGEDTRGGLPLEGDASDPDRGTVPGRAFAHAYDDRRTRRRVRDAVRSEMEINYGHLIPDEGDLVTSISGIIEAFPEEAAGIIAQAVAEHVSPETMSEIARVVEAASRRPTP